VTPLIAALIAAAVVAALAFVLVPNRAQRAERAGGAAGDTGIQQGRRAAELALTAAALGLKLSWDEPDLVERFDFPPFGRGTNPKASHVLRGPLEGIETVAFDYSFALPSEARRREFRVTVIPAPFPEPGRWRLSARPWDAAQGAGTFEDRWRVDEHPPGDDAGPTEKARDLLLSPRFVSSAIVLDSEVLALIDAGAGDIESLESDVHLLCRLAGTMRRQVE
jgi:hypothetical protein